jgi:hypothetical protein
LTVFPQVFFLVLVDRIFLHPISCELVFHLNKNKFIFHNCQTNHLLELYSPRLKIATHLSRIVERFRLVVCAVLPCTLSCLSSSNSASTAVKNVVLSLNSLSTHPPTLICNTSRCRLSRESSPRKGVSLPTFQANESLIARSQNPRNQQQFPTYQSIAPFILTR